VSTIQTKIAEAFLTRLDSTVGRPPIAYTGFEFTPPSTGVWWRAKHFPNESTDFLIAGEEAIQVGFFQVQVFGRPGIGELGLLRSAEDVIARFPKGLSIFNEVRVRKRPTVAPVIEEDSTVNMPVSVFYRGPA